MLRGALTSKPTWRIAFGAIRQVGFFCLPQQHGCLLERASNLRLTMNDNKSAMAQEIAQVAIAFQRERTGHAPTSATVLLDDSTLVITLHEALSPAEKALAVSPTGAAQVQHFHRQLFLSSANLLRKEITRITGREVHEAAAEIEPVTGAVVHAFTTGNMVQVFRLNGAVPGNGRTLPANDLPHNSGDGV